jgi:CBS domain-containing protein
MTDAPEARPRQHADAQLPDPFLRLRMSDAPRRPPVFAAPEDTVAEAARRMSQAGATAALIRAADTGPILGILTERDVLGRVAAAGLPPSATLVREVMTGGLITASPDELLIEAFSRMVRRGVRRLVLMDEDGRALGLVGEGELLAARGESPLALASDIDAADGAEPLARTFRRLSALAARSIAEGIGSGPVGRLISEMHDRIMAKALDLTLAELGPAPCAHCLLVLGSQGRREQYLATDMDLGLAYAEAHQEEWFGRLGARLTELLLAIGFPPCRSRIMPDNADWRRSSDGWLDLVDAACDRPDAEAVVKASLLADMRPIATEQSDAAGLGAALRAAILERLGKCAILLKFMAREATRFSPPLGVFSGFSLRRDQAGGGWMDIKRGGVFAVTQGAKVLALDHGAQESGTCRRLQRLAADGALSRALAGDLCEAYELLQTLRMRAQAEAIARGAQPGNEIRPDGLGALEAGRLRASLRLVSEFQGLIFEKYGLRLLG